MDIDEVIKMLIDLQAKTDSKEVYVTMDSGIGCLIEDITLIGNDVAIKITY